MWNTPLPNSKMSRLAVLMAVATLAAACSSGSSNEAGQTSTTSVGQPTTEVLVPDSSAPVPSQTDPLFDVVVPTPDPAALPVDSDVRIGVLDNGLTYYLRHNDSPGGRLELRLVVNAGSLQQEDPDSGLAHFVEHMLFNGTRQYPDNELDKILQDLGLAIGPDVNAFTSFDETVYSLSVATASASDVDTGLAILHEWAQWATIEADAVVEERGVVREERRARTESADGRQFDVFLDAYTTGSDYDGASPIGSAEGILATTAVEARRFYDRWYRPDLMAVVLVGDVPLGVMEDEVVERFSDLTSRGDDQSHVDAAVTPIDGRWIDVLLDEETSARRISLDYWIPSWDEGTVGGERLVLLEQILGRLIDNRLNDATDRGEISAISPVAGPLGVTRGVRLLGFNFGGEDLALVTEEVIAELRRIEVLGFTDVELHRVLDQFRGANDLGLEGVGTRQDAEYAMAYVNHFLAGSDISAASESHDRIDGLLDEFDVADVTAHFRYLMSLSAPLLAALGQTPQDVPTIPELEAALERGLAADVGSLDTSTDTFVTELMPRPNGVEAVRTEELEEIFAFQMDFANGASALFMESDISEGSVNLIAISDGGWSVLTVGEAQLAGLATSAVQQSGLGDLDRVQVNTFLDGSIVALTPFIDEVDEGFFGSAAVDDVELLFQLLHLSVTSPRVDLSGFRAAVEAAETEIRAASSDPRTLSVAELFDARYGTSEYPRIVPGSEAVAAATEEDLLAIYLNRLGQVDDLVVAVVGDIDAGVIEEYFERYVGTLPAGSADEHVDLWPSPPEGVILRDVTAGASDAGAGVDFLFTAEVDVTERSALTADIVSNIVRSRLFDSVREDLGASYGVNVSISSSISPDEVVESLIVASGDPDRLDLITDTILDSVHDLATNGPTVDEFVRAKAILASDYELVSNFDLMFTLIDTAISGGLDPFTRREAFALIEMITIDEVADLALAMFPTDRWIQVRRG